jgi:hypothetical protein
MVFDMPTHEEMNVHLRAQVAALEGRLTESTDYSIQLQQLIESLTRTETPHEGLHHHKMIMAAKAERDAQQARLKVLEQAAQALVDAWKAKPPLAWQPENNPTLLENLAHAMTPTPETPCTTKPQ